MKGLEQLALLPITKLVHLQLPQHKLRLGHLVERFISNQLHQINNIKVLAENLQIKQAKQTIGELDVLLLQNNTPVHLEIVYKFYLYDETVGTNELEHWIGPNKKDSLVHKLNKLKTKQLPLLHNSETQQALKQFNISISTIKQYVHFKAQLFVPFQQGKTTYPFINNACIVGVYLNLVETIHFKDYLWYLPNKYNWLATPQLNVHWYPYEKAIAAIKTLLTNKRAPLCWVKTPNNELKKIFVVWW